MADYCTVSDVQIILPNENLIGDSLLDTNVNILTSDVESWITFSSQEIDGYLSTVYVVPLIAYKQPDFTASPVTFTAFYPPPVPLICARLAASHIYDEIIMAQQSPNVSEWGQNQRNLAFDDITQIQSGLIVLPNQKMKGMRFARRELLDDARVSRPGEYQTHSRSAGK